MFIPAGCFDCILLFNYISTTIAATIIITIINLLFIHNLKHSKYQWIKCINGIINWTNYA
jgi:hypothetical protein